MDPNSYTIIRPRSDFEVVYLYLYFLMGWLAIIAIALLVNAFPASGFVLLVSGAVIYISGLIVYSLERRLLHAHGIWHFFCISPSFAIRLRTRLGR
ncbi:MAG: hypothetical protein GKR87_04215 [Kiritimatiellae bacterium]|nr:hypothetical protein [Kiritimatiellia bacterium]